MSAPPNSIFSRSREMMALLAKLGQKELGSKMGNLVGTRDPLRDLKTQLDQAHLLVESLGRLKGAAMKAGQLLSIEARDFLPPEVIDILSKLQDNARGMSFEEIETILKSELGEARFADLEGLSFEPIAAASIGQVHKATHQGQQVAIKVQFPGIAQTIESDLSMLRNIARGFLAISRKPIDLEHLFEELKTVLLQEVDYKLEAELMSEYHDLLKKHPGYLAPSVVPELTTSHVLTMSFEHGLKLTEWLATNPPQELRNEFGQKVLDLYTLEFFVAGLVQTDPNFANFLFRPIEHELVVLDFGATKRYTPEFRDNYRALLKKIRSASDGEILEHSIKMGLLLEGESPECQVAYCHMLRMSIEPFADHRQPFNFNDLDYSSEVRNATVAFTKLINHSPPPHQIIFLHRKLGGIFSMLKTMKAQIDLRPYWEKLVSTHA